MLKMVSYQYSYIMLDGLFLVGWLALFWWRKNVRKQMLAISVVFGIFSFFAESLAYTDWWKPLTITGNIPGIESFLFGFTVGGFASVIYEEIFKKKIKVRKLNKIKIDRRNLHISRIASFLLIVFLASQKVFGISTIIATILCSVPIIIFIYIKRKDLIVDSIFSGLLVTLTAIFVYFIISLITPGWIDAFWLFQVFPKILIFGLPIEEIITYFLIGALFGPLYEYWQEGKLINVKD